MNPYEQGQVFVKDWLAHARVFSASLFGPVVTLYVPLWINEENTGIIYTWSSFPLRVNHI
jgi:hypothetical protein